MIPLLMLLIGQTAAGNPAPEPPPADIVVVAKQRRCSVQFGGRKLSNRQLDTYAKLWSQGREVRVHVAPGASYTCMAKVMFRLADRGVKRATFVDDPVSRPSASE